MRWQLIGPLSKMSIIIKHFCAGMSSSQFLKLILQLTGLLSGIPLKMVFFCNENKYHKTKDCLGNEAV